MGAQAPQDPVSVERMGDSGLHIRWADGHESLYGWVALRAQCPCAACGEIRKGLPVGTPPSVTALEIKPVGNYAMGFRFSDGHMTGIFTFEFLRSICPCEACQPRQMTEG